MLMSDDDAMIIKALKESGFPFERKTRKKISELGIETYQSRYFVQNQYGETSKDIDVLGDVKFKTFESKDKELFPTLELRFVGEVKKWNKYKICFYEFDEVAGNFPISFPNFLNNCYSFGVFNGGHELLTNFHRKFGDIPFSKSICVLEKKFKPQKGGELVEDGYDDKGNQPIYITSNDLASACEYFHRKILYSRYLESPCIMFSIHGCFPIIFTGADIIRVSGIDDPTLDKVDYFLYLHACQDLDKVPITAKEKYYLPILITNFNGIDSSIDLINKISDLFYKEVEDLVIKQPLKIKAEFEDYKKIIEMFKK